MVHVQFVSLHPSSSRLLLHASCVAVADAVMTSHAMTKCNSMYVITCPMKAVYDVAIFMRLTFDVALYTDPHWSNYLAVTLERNLTKFLRPEESRRHCPDYTGVSRLPQLKCLEVHVI